MVTIFPRQQRNAGELMQMVPISSGAIGVHLEVECDLTATNSFKLEYHDGVKRRLVARLNTPITDIEVTSVWCELMPSDTGLAGKTLPVYLTIERAGDIGLTGEPLI